MEIYKKQFAEKCSENNITSSSSKETIATPLFANSDFFSGLTHFAGFILSIAALVLLVVFSHLYGTLAHKIGFTIFGISLALLYAASSIYHFFPRNRHQKKIFQRIDHAMVFVLMAGSYTPICLTINNRACGWGMLCMVWFVAIIGIALKLSGKKISEALSTSIYVCFGLLMLTAVKPLFYWLPKDAFGWLFGGGLLYLIGVIFYVIDDFVVRKYAFWMHEIWHLFVMAGSFCHFWCVLHYILYLN